MMSIPPCKRVVIFGRSVANRVINPLAGYKSRRVTFDKLYKYMIRNFKFEHTYIMLPSKTLIHKNWYSSIQNIILKLVLNPTLYRFCNIFISYYIDNFKLYPLPTLPFLKMVVCSLPAEFKDWGDQGARPSTKELQHLGNSDFIFIRHHAFWIIWNPESDTSWHIN